MLCAFVVVHHMGAGLAGFFSDLPPIKYDEVK